MKRKINLIVAKSLDNIIGVNDELPWKLSSDLKYFKEMTRGSCVIVGRKTYESIKTHFTKRNAEPLPGRQKIVITGDPEYKDKYAKTLYVAKGHSIADFLWTIENPNIFIIGGGQIFKEVLNKDLIDYLYITEVNAELTTPPEEINDLVIHYFPKINPNEWKEISRKKGFKDDKNEFDYDFVVYERIRDVNI